MNSPRQLLLLKYLQPWGLPNSLHALLRLLLAKEMKTELVIRTNDGEISNTK